MYVKINIDVLDELLRDETFKAGMGLISTLVTAICLLAWYIWKTTIKNFQENMNQNRLEFNDKLDETNKDRHEDAVALRKEMSKMNSNFLKFADQLSKVKEEIAVTKTQVQRNTEEIKMIKQQQ